MGAKIGHEVSAETRAKISAALKGRKISPEVLARRKGQKQSPELVERRVAPIRKYGPDSKCSVDGCDRKPSSRGWCDTHYRRWYVHGDPLFVTEQVGEQANHWKGDDIGYTAAHRRARHLPRQCTVCGTSDGRLEIALLHTADPSNLRGEYPRRYSVKVSDYVRLCVTCHRRYDSPQAETRASIERLLTQ